jgi:hypothetical protein
MVACKSISNTIPAAAHSIGIPFDTYMLDGAVKELGTAPSELQ